MVATHTPSLRFRLAAGAVAAVVTAVAVVVAVVVWPRHCPPTPVNALWARVRDSRFSIRRAPVCSIIRGSAPACSVIGCMLQEAQTP